MFAHLDAGPHNGLMTPNGLRLLDFEMAGFGNVLVDVVGRGRRFRRRTGDGGNFIASVNALEASYRGGNCGGFPRIGRGSGL